MLTDKTKEGTTNTRIVEIAVVGKQYGYGTTRLEVPADMSREDIVNRVVLRHLDVYLDFDHPFEERYEEIDEIRELDSPDAQPDKRLIHGPGSDEWRVEDVN